MKVTPKEADWIKWNLSPGDFDRMAQHFPVLRKALEEARKYG